VDNQVFDKKSPLAMTKSISNKYIDRKNELEGNKLYPHTIIILIIIVHFKIYTRHVQIIHETYLSYENIFVFITAYV
jgi:hypothetical protein